MTTQIQPGRNTSSTIHIANPILKTQWTSIGLVATNKKTHEQLALVQLTCHWSGSPIRSKWLDVQGDLVPMPLDTKPHWDASDSQTAARSQIASRRIVNQFALLHLQTLESHMFTCLVKADLVKGCWSNWDGHRPQSKVPQCMVTIPMFNVQSFIWIQKTCKIVASESKCVCDFPMTAFRRNDSWENCTQPACLPLPLLSACWACWPSIDISHALSLLHRTGGMSLQRDQPTVASRAPRPRP